MALAILALSTVAIAATSLDTAVVDDRPLAGPDGEVSMAERPLTPAQREIAKAEKRVHDDPKNAELHTSLAIALSRRARETADPKWYGRSDASLLKSLQISPNNFQACRQQVWNQLGRHEFADALKGARSLNQRAKDDVLTYGLLVDANVELGHYAAAEEAAQWMLNLRPGAPAALTRVSYLREQFGDVQGAVDVMNMAFHSTRPSDTEDRAWILAHLAHLESERGHPGRAVAFAENALRLFPGYHYALAELARARFDSGDRSAARELLQQRYDVASHPENLFELAVVVETMGEVDEAQRMFRAFERDALVESKNVDNANLQLIEYWLEHTGGENVGRALRLAEVRAAERRDIATLSGLGWAQFHAGEHAVAWETLSEVLAVGTRNPKIRYRAGVVARAVGELDAAREQWRLALQDAPKSSYGMRALDGLMELEK